MPSATYLNRSDSAHLSVDYNSSRQPSYSSSPLTSPVAQQSLMHTLLTKNLQIVGSKSPHPSPCHLHHQSSNLGYISGRSATYPNRSDSVHLSVNCNSLASTFIIDVTSNLSGSPTIFDAYFAHEKSPDRWKEKPSSLSLCLHHQSQNPGFSLLHSWSRSTSVAGLPTSTNSQPSAQSAICLISLNREEASSA